MRTGFVVALALVGVVGCGGTAASIPGGSAGDGAPVATSSHDGGIGSPPPDSGSAGEDAPSGQPEAGSGQDAGGGGAEGGSVDAGHPSDSCVPLSCADYGYQCGSIVSCGTLFDCGSCPSTQACVPTGAGNVCVYPPEASSPLPCGPDTCSGCCLSVDGSTSCQPGNTVEACGAGGIACDACIDNATCVSSGASRVCL